MDSVFPICGPEIALRSDPVLILDNTAIEPSRLELFRKAQLTEKARVSWRRWMSRARNTSTGDG